MLKRESARLVMFLGGALTVQLFGSAVVMCLAACPNTKPKSITCPTDHDDKCAVKPGSENPSIDCVNDKKVHEKKEQPLEDQDNPGEETKTRTDPDDEDRVFCYSHFQCDWVNGECVQFGTTVYNNFVNPLEEVDC